MLELKQGFNKVVGHRDIIQHMKNAIRLKKISHAYLFSGERGSGKKMLSSIFAMTLLCAKGGEEPCGVCTSCKKILSGNHPDVIMVQHEKPNTVGIDDIRTQLVGSVEIRPYESRYKIYIIPDAHKMTVQAQNALLKTIEEPPSYAVIMLLADNPDILLQTVLSRCVHLKLKPLPEKFVKEYLIHEMHVPAYQAAFQASFSQGNIGRAIQMAKSEEFAEMTQNAVQLLKRSKNMEVYELVDAIKSMSAEKQNIYEYLELFTMWFRDVLLFKATKDVDSLVFKEDINYIKERAAVSSYEGLENILNAIRNADGRLRANVNFDLVMELLFLTIRES